MHKLIYLLKQYYVILLFIILEGIAVNYYVKSNSYTRAKAQMKSTQITAGSQKIINSITGYFQLRKTNSILTEEIADLKNRLEICKLSENYSPLDTLKYSYTTAKVISNSIARQNNYFVIDKGNDDGVEENMAVITVKGAVAGYVQSCSNKYSVCMSVLNIDFRLGGRIKGKDFFGSVYWDGVSAKHLHLSDIPRYANIAKNDTILSVHSLRFPKDSFIGVIDEVSLTDDGNFFDIKVKLEADMTSLNEVILVHHTDFYELQELAGDYFPDNK